MPAALSIATATAAACWCAFASQTERAERAVILNPDLKLGEEYMNGGLVIEAGSIYDFLAARYEQRSERRTEPWWFKAAHRGRYAMRRFRQFNTPVRARATTSTHHYDLDGRLYSALPRRRPAIFLRLFRGRRDRA